jgi:type IV pilus assembly protein PilE
MTLRPHTRPKAACGGRGFTLIEILVAIVIVGIVASLAMPAFFESIRKSRRSEAVAALTNLQQAQERRRANEPTYTTDLPSLGIPSPTTANGMYTLVIDAADAVGYTATATAAGKQTSDDKCTLMRVRANRGNILYGSACKTCTMADPMTDPNRCWSRQ